MLVGVADTHAVIWYIFANPKLSSTAKGFIDGADYQASRPYGNTRYTYLPRPRVLGACQPRHDLALYTRAARRWLVYW